MKALELANILDSNMTSIGFISRKKRLEAYAITTTIAEEMSIAETGNTALAFDALAILSRTNKAFYKAAYMTIINLEKMPKGLLNNTGYLLAKELRESGKFLL